MKKPLDLYMHSHLYRNCLSHYALTKYFFLSDHQPLKRFMSTAQIPLPALGLPQPLTIADCFLIW